MEQRPRCDGCCALATCRHIAWEGRGDGKRELGLGNLAGPSITGCDYVTFRDRHASRLASSCGKTPEVDVRVCHDHPTRRDAFIPLCSCMHYILPTYSRNEL